MDNPGEQDKFHYVDRFFDNQDDFFAYVKEVDHRIVSESDLEYHTRLLIRYMKMYLLLVSKKNVKNFQMRTIMEELFQYFMTRIIYYEHLDMTNNSECPTHSLEGIENLKNVDLPPHSIGEPNTTQHNV